MSKRVFVALVLIFAFACLLLPGQAFALPALSITKSHMGNFTVGTNGTYTITVMNSGDATSGTIKVTDTLPNGLGFVSGMGMGWSCSASGQTVICTNPGSIASGGQSTITLTVSVCGPSVVNQASVSGGGTNGSVSSNSDMTTVNGGNPALSITKSHMGNFTVGTNGTYTLTVTNAGTAATCGTVTVTDTLPPGLTFIVGTGTNWSCSASGQMVTCTTTAAINGGGQSFITLTASVGVTAVPGVSNTASVSGGGASGSASSNSDMTTVNMTVKSGPAVYVSTFAGQQVVVVDGAVGTTAPIHTVPNSGMTAGTFTPEDIVVGPDRKIYICDPANGKIYRVRQDDKPGSFETIYDLSSAASPNNPGAPEGPSFKGSDLYFNNHLFPAGSQGGVWKIANATGPVGGPTKVFDSAAAGEGTVFGTAGTTAGKLLFVERSTNQVLSCDISPLPCSPSTLIQNSEGSPLLDNPIGIAVSPIDIPPLISAGDIFVANAGTLNAGSLHNINHFNSSGGFVETYASFSGSGFPFFLGFDALGRLYLVTNDLSGAGGKVWRIDPPGGETNLVFLVALSNSITGVNSDDAVGLGLAPNAAITKAYSSTTKSNTFDFTSGLPINQSDTVIITFTGVSTDFELTVLREEVPEALLELQLEANFDDIPCFEYDSDRGTCVVYEDGIGAKLDPLPPMDYTGPVDYQVFYTPPPGANIGKPVLAHAEDNNLQTPVDQYDEDELTGFTKCTALPCSGDPDGMDGTSGTISRHVALSTPLVAGAAGNIFCPLPPVATGGLTFFKPQIIAIKFQIALPGGSCAAGPFLMSPSPKSQLWLFDPATSKFITPTASGSSSIPNAFHFDPLTGVSIFNLNTANLFAPPPPAHEPYIFTITSDSVSAHVSFFFLQRVH